MNNFQLVLQKLKAWASDAWAGFNMVFTSSAAKALFVMGSLLGLAFYYITLKHKEIAALRAQLGLIGTQKQADVLQSDIQDKLNNVNLLQKQIDEYNNVLVELEEKRKDLPEGNDHDPVTYWDNNSK